MATSDSDDDDLRRWRLPRGRHGLPRELVVRSQRERLLAAVVRVTAARGYESTSVADILEEAGVGRESFYELFDDKRDCLLAARGILVDDLEQSVRAAYAEGETWVDRVANGLATMLEWFASDPAAARVVMVELAAVGPASRELFQVDFNRFTALLEEGLEQAPDPSLAQATNLAIAGGLARVYGEVSRGRAEALPELLPELLYELLVPFTGEAEARIEQQGAAAALAAGAERLSRSARR